MENFDVLYWADHISRFDLKVNYDHKVRQGNVFNFSGHMNKARLVNSYQTGVFVLSKEETSIFIDRLIQQNYPELEFLQIALTEAENQPVLDPFPHSKKLENILFLKYGRSSFRAYRHEDLKHLGHLERGSRIWTDIYSTRNQDCKLFSFWIERDSSLSDYTMEEFLTIRSSSRFPEEEYKKLIRSIKRNPRKMHSSVRDFLDQCPKL